MDTKDLLELTQEVGVDGNTTVGDLLGLQSEIPELIYQINVGKYRLAITFGGQEPPTIKKFRSGKKIKNNSSTVLYLKNSKTKAEAAVKFNVSKPIEMDDEIDDDYFEDDSDFDLE